MASANSKAGAARILQVLDWNQLPLVLTNEDIAALFRMSLRTVQDYAWRAPERLPPRLHIPGSAGVRYSRDIVRSWLEDIVAGRLTPPPRKLSGCPLGRQPGSTTENLRARREAESAAQEAPGGP